MRQLMGMMLVVGLVVWIAATALAQGGGYDYGTQPAGGSKAQTQLQTAILHAKNSAGSGAMASAVSHLGHVLNCIEGTKGKNFNASWGHVCQGQGDGILTDIRGERNAAGVMLVLDTADELAGAGVKAGNLASVQNAARGVAALLQIVTDGTR